MQLFLHQTHHQVADFNPIGEYLKAQSKKEGLHLFCELFLTGYPLQDLCLQKPFIENYLDLLKELNNYFQKMPKNDNIHILVGGLDYELTEQGQPKIIKNVVFHLTPGQELKAIYTKQLLPSYDIFDEAKYYQKGDSPCVVEISNHKFGILICEDMWPSNVYHVDPTEQLKEHCEKNKIKLDFVLNLSASPFNLEKQEKRHQRAMTIAKIFNCPFCYVNRVGGEDEILFDGNSFIADGEGILAQGKVFADDVVKFEKSKAQHLSKLNIKELNSVNTWEDLLSAALVDTKEGKRVKDLTDQDAQNLMDALIFGVQEYAQKCGFSRFLVALSGGMDSALVLALLKIGLKEGQTIEAVYMPSQYSASLSYDLSFELCKSLSVPLKTFPIKFLHSSIKNAYLDCFSEMLSGLGDENIQSRLRGALIYTRSNMTGAMVINTSNKSELAVGYSTQYGDSVGAISMLGDVYKSEVFQLARYINKKYNNIIPEGIITRPPSAELRENQKDTDSLPPYEVLDAILEGILSYQLSKNDFKKFGFSEEVIQKVFNLYRKTEYKRSQFCPIIKVKGKSFGFGYRIPTSKSSSFYVD